MKKHLTIFLALFLLAYFTGCTTYTAHTTYSDGSSQDYTTIGPDYSAVVASLFLIPIVVLAACGGHHHHHHHHGPSFAPPPRGFRH